MFDSVLNATLEYFLIKYYKMTQTYHLKDTDQQQALQTAPHKFFINLRINSCWSTLNILNLSVQGQKWSIHEWDQIYAAMKN